MRGALRTSHRAQRIEPPRIDDVIRRPAVEGLALAIALAKRFGARLENADLGPHIQRERIGVVGHSNGGYTPLQTPTAAEQALLTKYDVPPLVPNGSQGAIPFLDFGNQYAIGGAGYLPSVLAGLTWTQIAADLSNPHSSVAQPVLGTANYITAAICKITGNAPATACTSTIQSLESQI